MKNLILFLAIAIISSCVSPENEKVVKENEALRVEQERLKREMEDLKYGASNLLSEGKRFFEAGNYSQAKTKFASLLERHSDKPQAIEAKTLLTTIEEEELWQLISSSEEISNCDKYLASFKNGKYIKGVKTRKRELTVLNMQKAYDNASNMNTSMGWKSFLSDYPDHAMAKEIKRKIIQLEVDEIINDRSTGQMPGFNQIGYGYSENSTVKITNDTGCELIVRYSGSDVKSISIPEGATKSVYLSSGNYKVAATACGYKYAGSETLGGNYSSRFYISSHGYY